MADFEFKAPSTSRPVVRYVITGVIVVALLAVLVWAVARHFHKASDNGSLPSAPNTSQSQNGSSDQGANSGPGVSNSGNSPSGSGDSSSSNGSSSSPDSHAGSSTGNKPKSSGTRQLTNTGPGDVAALFAGAAALGSLGYEFYLRRRVARQG
jgi:cytoskeletal protein RodZ